MRLQQTKFWMGATLSLFLPLLAVSPSMAQSTQGSSDSIQSNYSQPMYGTVRTMSGNTVRVVFPNGNIQSFRLQSADLSRLNLQYGTPVYVTMLPDGSARIALTSMDMNSSMSSATGMNSSSMNSMDSSSTYGMNNSAMAAGGATVTAVNDNVVTVRTANGDTKQFLIPRDQLQMMNLQPGAQMVIFGDNLSADRVIVGNVKQIVGNIATIQDNKGDIHDVQLSRTRIESLNLRPGQRVAVADGGFEGPHAVFLLPQVEASSNTSVYSSTTSSTTITQPAAQMSNNDSAIATVVTQEETVQPAPLPAQAEEENVPVTPAPSSAPAPQPIRAMW